MIFKLEKNKNYVYNGDTAFIKFTYLIVYYHTKIKRSIS